MGRNKNERRGFERKSIAQKQRNKNERRGFERKSIAQKQRNKNEKGNKSECNKNEWGQYFLYFLTIIPLVNPDSGIQKSQSV